jgi:tRNA uridine 5-carboxymethylaminomethyl modification enzyme
MFTSRAEYRLLLRVDNADLRLTPRGRQVGLIDEARWEAFHEREARFVGNLQRLKTAKVKDANGATVAADQWLRQPASKVETLVRDGLVLQQPVSRLDIPSVETTLKYEGYLKRQESDIQRRSRDEHRRIPREFRYAGVPGLSSEVVQRLDQVRPETIGQAMRVPGVTPAAITVLSTYVSRHI